MKARQGSIRTSLDIPQDLHRQVHEIAARRGCSARKLMLEGIAGVVATEVERPKRRLNLEKNPPIPADGRRLRSLTNEEVYDLIGFP